jgi:hypothetical protein
MVIGRARNVYIPLLLNFSIRRDSRLLDSLHVGGDADADADADAVLGEVLLVVHDSAS